MLCPGASSAQQRCSSGQPSDAVVRRVICTSATRLSVLPCRCGCPAAWLHGPLWLVRHASCTRFSCGAAAALQQQQQRSAAICRVMTAADPVFSLCMRSLCSLAAYFHGPTAGNGLPRIAGLKCRKRDWDSEVCFYTCKQKEST